MHGKHLPFSDGGSGVCRGDQAQKSSSRGNVGGNQGVARRKGSESEGAFCSAKSRAGSSVFFFHFTHERNADDGGYHHMYDAATAGSAGRSKAKFRGGRRESENQKQCVLFFRSHGERRARSLRQKRRGIFKNVRCYRGGVSRNRRKMVCEKAAFFGKNDGKRSNCRA